MSTEPINMPFRSMLWRISVLFLFTFTTTSALAKQNIRDAFFAVYPDAVGTVIETVPSRPNHCGVCHYEFSGGGPRNPYGVLLEGALQGFPNNPAGREAAVLSIENDDPDGDGFSTLVEVTDTVNFSNTPSFPGLTPSNIGSVTGVDVAEIEGHLIPVSGGDVTPPDVEVLTPNGGEMLEANTQSVIEWSATDASGVVGVDLYLSDDGGATFTPLALGKPNSGSFTWFPANRPTGTGIVRVVAFDPEGNDGFDNSDAAFTIYSPPGGIVPTTLRDFDQPGSQPLEAGVQNDPSACAVCHGNYDFDVEPYFTWRGSMMAHASRDPLFEAAMVIANQDAPDSGDLCLRCHLPKGWLEGRSVPTDGSQMLETDMIGVSCDHCHRLVDPIFDAGANPAVDEEILASLSNPPDEFGNGMFVIDPSNTRRGPYADADLAHPILVSPFHREAALCGTCHDVSNTAFAKDGMGNYVPNNFDEPADGFAASYLLPIERTYSEWFFSQYNTEEGVFAPQFGGNKDFVASCQDCHMRDVTGKGCAFPDAPVRDDLPLHDMTGGNTWMPTIIQLLFPDEVDPAAIAAGITRARYMLQNAAELATVQEGEHLKVTVTNNTGHKLPTGYPEGRRMWLNVKFYDEAMSLIGESGAYDTATGELTLDAEAKVYEVKPGLSEDVAGLVGTDPGPSFHFVLNSVVYKDNRIPPRGFNNATFEVFGGQPVDYTYADGQFWDDTLYDIPAGAVTANATLYYQSTSKEFIEFLRDENTTNAKGQQMYDLWNENGKSPPEVMATAQIELTVAVPGDADGDGDVDLDDYLGFYSCLGGPGVPVGEACFVFDADADADVDAGDFAAFATGFTAQGG